MSSGGRGIAAALALALGFGCAEAPILVVDVPLLVTNTYPANGATLARSDLGELAISFSADLGEPTDARALARDYLEFGPEGGDPLPFVRADLTNVAYDARSFTLRILLDDSVRRKVDAGPHVLRVGEGLEAADGRPLPAALEFRFVVARR